MNVVMYAVLWIAIGLLAGLIANWVTEAATWPWFWVDLLTGFIGAVLFGFLVPRLLHGAGVVYDAYSLIFALFGAVLLLLGCGLLRRVL